MHLRLIVSAAILPAHRGRHTPGAVPGTAAAGGSGQRRRVQLRISTGPRQGATHDDLLAVARRTEETGPDAPLRADHPAMGGAGLPGPADGWVTPAGLARGSSRIRPGTPMAAATSRLPGPPAISVAQVDQMGGGRVELGPGSGWYEQLG